LAIPGIHEAFLEVDELEFSDIHEKVVEEFVVHLGELFHGGGEPFDLMLFEFWKVYDEAHGGHLDGEEGDFGFV